MPESNPEKAPSTRESAKSPAAPSQSLRHLYEEAAQNEEILKRYQGFELRMLSAATLGELLDTLVNVSLEYFTLEAVELWLCDPQQTLDEFLPEEFIDNPRLQLLKRERTLERLYGGDAEKAPAVRLVSTRDMQSLPVFKDRRIGSAAMLPLHRKGRYVGSMHLGARSDQRFTADKSTDFVRHLASIVAVCIENALGQEHLRRLSMLDVLTRVKNRRAFDLALDSELSRASRSGDPMSLLFVDLDHFKAINDTYGHPMGDKVLREVAQVFRDTLRKVDHVCRYGGEEFAMVMPNCNKQMAMDIAERLRLRVSQLRIEIDDENSTPEDTISVTLSMGVCSWTPDRRQNNGEDPSVAKKVAETLISCADHGVYESKAGGRNTIRYVDFASG